VLAGEGVEGRLFGLRGVGSVRQVVVGLSGGGEGLSEHASGALSGMLSEGVSEVGLGVPSGVEDEEGLVGVGDGGA